MSTENQNPQENDAARQQLSRRTLLAAAGGSAIAGIAGCASNNSQPRKMGIMQEQGAKVASPPDKKPDIREDQPAVSFNDGVENVKRFRKDLVPELGPPHTNIHGVLFCTAGGDGG